MSKGGIPLRYTGFRLARLWRCSVASAYCQRRVLRVDVLVVRHNTAFVLPPLRNHELILMHTARSPVNRGKINNCKMGHKCVLMARVSDYRGCFRS